MGPLAQLFLCRNQIERPLTLGDITLWQYTWLKAQDGFQCPLNSLIGTFPSLYSARPTQPHMAILVLVPCGGLLQVIDLFPGNTYIIPFTYGAGGKETPLPSGGLLSVPASTEHSLKPVSQLRALKGRHRSYCCHPPTPAITGELSYNIPCIMMYFILHISKALPVLRFIIDFVQLPQCVCYA